MRTRILLCAVAACAAAVVTVGSVSAQAPANPRFARWKLKSENPPPQSNIMTYEAYNGTGMKVRIDTVSATGATGGWGYITMFDGKDEPVEGRQGQTSAVRVVNDKINAIVNKTNGRVTQFLVNVLSADNNSIEVSYFTTNAQGATNVTHATYERLPAGGAPPVR